MISNEEYLDQLLSSALSGDEEMPKTQSESEKPEIQSDSKEPEVRSESAKAVGAESAEEVNPAEEAESEIAEEKIFIKEEILEKLDRDNMTWDEMMELPIDTVLSALEDDGKGTAETAVPQETAAPQAEPSDDPGHMMSADEIAALLAAGDESGGDTGQAAEPEAEKEEVPVETAAPQAELSNDPGHMMSADEIAAVLAANEERGAEEEEEKELEETTAPEEEEELAATVAPQAEPSDDPGHMMSADEIAALLAANEESAADAEEEKELEETTAPEEEEELAETVAPQTELSDDPGHMMSADEIAALLAANEESAAEVEEEKELEETTVPEEEEELAETVAPQTELSDDPGHMMSADEIAALLAANEESGAEEKTEEAAAPQEELRDDPDHAMSADEIAALFASQDESGEEDEIGGVSEEDIEKQLEKAVSQGMEEAEGSLPKEDSDQDLIQMIDELESADEGLSDIADLLKKSDQNELVDESIAKENDDFSIDGENKPADSEEGDKPAKEKKPGLFSRLFNALTDDGEDENEEDKESVPEKDATKLSDENLNILNEIDAENEKKKAKKEKKEKKEKEKQAKKEKKEKEKKPKAPKKEKPKKAAIDAEPAIRIPRKYIVRTFLVSFSLLAVILIPAMYLPIIQMKEAARDAYYQGDYEEAFLCMYGKKLDESDQLIYESARTIILLERKYDSYETYKDMQWDYQAVDALIQGVGKYEDLYAEAERLGVLNQLNATRARIEAVLMSEYQLTWDEAAEILKYDALDYTNKLYSLVDGTEFHFKSDEINASYGLPTVSREDTDNGNDTEVPDLPDLLPEEMDYINQQTGEPESGLPDAVQENPSVPAYGDVNGTPVDVEIDSNQF